MASTDLVKQFEKPLFPDIFWNRPLNRQTAKKLLIIGGHSKQFSQTQASYSAAKASGIGDAKVVLPESTRKYVKSVPDCLFVAETKSGSLAKAAYPQIKAFIKESDGVLLAGESSINSETTSLMEHLLVETKKPLIISNELVATMLYRPQSLRSHPNRLVLAPTKLLLKLADALKLAIKLQAGGLPAKNALLGALAADTKLDIILLGHELMVSSGTKTSVTNVDDFLPDMFGLTRGVFATFYLQHADKFQALTTAAYVLSKVSKLKNQGLASSLKNLKHTIDTYS